jgi:alkylation response protein AidB-like acyl-CoA dehydrogenase
MSENGSILSQDLLDRCRERAPQYDRDNRVAQEDFDELKEAGYLKMAVPERFGGRGMRLADAVRQTRRLAYYAPATALAINMHTYWVGLCSDIHRAGDHSLDWLLEEAGAGEVFAAGHAESGNDLPVLLSTTKAEPVEGGYKFTGRKSFGSLTPVWTRLGIHGLDTSDPAQPKIVHGFMSRDTEGVTIKETWDVMSMRATRSDDTILEGVFVPDKYIGRVVPAGAAGMDHFVLGIFAWALLAFGNVYYGIAKRVLDLTVESLKTKGSVGMTRPMIYHPEVQHGVAEMVLEIEAMGPHIESVAQDWSNTDEHGPELALRIVAAKHHCVTSAWRVADLGMELSGGFGMFKKNELERLFRDSRAGRFHPANPALTHELLAKMTLGIDLDEQPRWG